MQSVSSGDNMHEMPKPMDGENNKENIINHAFFVCWIGQESGKC